MHRTVSKAGDNQQILPSPNDIGIPEAITIARNIDRPKSSAFQQPAELEPKRPAQSKESDRVASANNLLSTRRFTNSIHTSKLSELHRLPESVKRILLRNEKRMKLFDTNTKDTTQTEPQVRQDQPSPKETIEVDRPTNTLINDLTDDLSTKGNIAPPNSIGDSDDDNDQSLTPTSFGEENSNILHRVPSEENLVSLSCSERSTDRFDTDATGELDHRAPAATTAGFYDGIAALAYQTSNAPQSVTIPDNTIERVNRLLSTTGQGVVKKKTGINYECLPRRSITLPNPTSTECNQVPPTKDEIQNANKKPIIYKNDCIFAAEEEYPSPILAVVGATRNLSMTTKSPNEERLLIEQSTKNKKFSKKHVDNQFKDTRIFTVEDEYPSPGITNVSRSRQTNSQSEEGIVLRNESNDTEICLPVNTKISTSGDFYILLPREKARKTLNLKAVTSADYEEPRYERQDALADNQTIQNAIDAAYLSLLRSTNPDDKFNEGSEKKDNSKTKDSIDNCRLTIPSYGEPRSERHDALTHNQTLQNAIDAAYLSLLRSSKPDDKFNEGSEKKDNSRTKDSIDNCRLTIPTYNETGFVDFATMGNKTRPLEPCVSGDGLAERDNMNTSMIDVKHCDNEYHFNEENKSQNIKGVDKTPGTDAVLKPPIEVESSIPVTKDMHNMVERNTPPVVDLKASPQIADEENIPGNHDENQDEQNIQERAMQTETDEPKNLVDKRKLILDMNTKWLILTPKRINEIPDFLVDVVFELNRTLQEEFIIEAFGVEVGSYLVTKVTTYEGLVWYAELIRSFYPLLGTEFLRNVRRHLAKVLPSGDIWGEVLPLFYPWPEKTFGQSFIKRLRDIFWYIVNCKLPQKKYEQVVFGILNVTSTNDIVPTILHFFLSNIVTEARLRYLIECSRRRCSKKQVAFSSSGKRDVPTFDELPCTKDELSFIRTQLLPPERQMGPTSLKWFLESRRCNESIQPKQVEIASKKGGTVKKSNNESCKSGSTKHNARLLLTQEKTKVKPKTPSNPKMSKKNCSIPKPGKMLSELQRNKEQALKGEYKGHPLKQPRYQEKYKDNYQKREEHMTHRQKETKLPEEHEHIRRKETKLPDEHEHHRLEEPIQREHKQWEEPMLREDHENHRRKETVTTGVRLEHDHHHWEEPKFLEEHEHHRRKILETYKDHHWGEPRLREEHEHHTHEEPTFLETHKDHHWEEPRLREEHEHHPHEEPMLREEHEHHRRKETKLRLEHDHHHWQDRRFLEEHEHHRRNEPNFLETHKDHHWEEPRLREEHEHHPHEEPMLREEHEYHSQKEPMLREEYEDNRRVFDYIQQLPPVFAPTDKPRQLGTCKSNLVNQREKKVLRYPQSRYPDQFYAMSKTKKIKSDQNNRYITEPDMFNSGYFAVNKTSKESLSPIQGRLGYLGDFNPLRNDSPGNLPRRKNKKDFIFYYTSDKCDPDLNSNDWYECQPHKEDHGEDSKIKQSEQDMVQYGADHLLRAGNQVLMNNGDMKGSGQEMEYGVVYNWKQYPTHDVKGLRGDLKHGRDFEANRTSKNDDNNCHGAKYQRTGQSQVLVDLENCNNYKQKKTVLELGDFQYHEMNCCSVKSVQHTESDSSIYHSVTSHSELTVYQSNEKLSAEDEVCASDQMFDPRSERPSPYAPSIERVTKSRRIGQHTKDGIRIKGTRSLKLPYYMEQNKPYSRLINRRNSKTIRNNSSFDCWGRN